MSQGHPCFVFSLCSLTDAAPKELTSRLGGLVELCLPGTTVFPGVGDNTQLGRKDSLAQILVATKSSI